MERTILFFLIAGLIFAGCGGSPASQSQPTPTTPGFSPELSETEPIDIETTELDPTSQPAAPAVPFNNRDIDPPALPEDSSDLVSASGNCAVCHTGLTDARGEQVSFDTLWRASMMAHSARDPYWLATVSTEIEEFPQLETVISDKCATCHMPLARFDAHTNQQPTLIFGAGFLNPTNQLHDLAMDGISCNVCHQIMGNNFDQPESFSGGYLIDTQNRAWGERISFGPLPFKEQSAMIMQQASGYLPVESDHISSPSMCGTCHNLYTPYLNSAGEIAGEFPEQTVYTEWQNSVFASGGSCAGCHMPKRNDVRLSNIVTTPQEYLRLHTFTGANAFMLKLLLTNAGEIGITAEEPEMRAAIQRVTDQLTSLPNTTVKMGDVTLKDGILETVISVQNNNGHKLPTGFPSRRVWLHVWVTDGNGEVIFESGDVDENGKINGNDNDSDPTLFEPHYDMIDDPEQVQIYETIMHNTENQVTTTLLRAAGYLKDNRLLPPGFPQEGVSPDISPYGAVTEDPDFVGGRDTIRYRINVSETSGPYTINFELYYQSIGYRWSENLRPYTTDRAIQFIQFYDQADKTPILIGSAQHFEEE